MIADAEADDNAAAPCESEADGEAEDDNDCGIVRALAEVSGRLLGESCSPTEPHEPAEPATWCGAAMNVWSAAIAKRVRALALVNRSPPRLGQRHLSLVEVSRAVPSGEHIGRLVIVHWLWQLRGRKLVGEDLPLRWGREVSCHRGKLVFSSELTHPAQTYQHDPVLVQDIGVAMLKEKVAHRSQVPTDVLRLQEMWQTASVESEADPIELPAESLTERDESAPTALPGAVAQCIACASEEPVDNSCVFVCSICCLEWHAACAVRVRTAIGSARVEAAVCHVQTECALCAKSRGGELQNNKTSSSLYSPYVLRMIL